MKKGFTLIELLAVLIILAVISLVTIPLVIGFITNSKVSSFIRGSENILHSAEIKYTSDNSVVENAPYTISYENGALVGTNSLELKGKTPDYATIVINYDGKVKLAIWDNDTAKCVTKTYLAESPTFYEAADKDECLAVASGIIPISYPAVADTNPGVICGTGGTENYAGNSVCYINSIEDLVAFSNLAKTNNFSGKTIHLNTNLDFNSNNSYVNPAGTTFGDINGDTVTESIKTELTTSSGFYPIGINTMAFRGIFEGNGNYLKNLYINRPTRSYVGLFGYAGYTTIRGFNIINANVTGGDNTGIVIGYQGTDSTVKSVSVKGNVTGGNNTGGISGSLNGVIYYGTSIYHASFSGNITGNNYVGGIVGYRSASYTTMQSGIFLEGSITCVSNCNRITGIVTPEYGYANSSILLNGATVASTNNMSLQGKDFNGLYKNEISLFENSYMDTYISDDDNIDGYYFDYAVDGNMAISKDTATITMAGAGTSGDPYLIYDYDDFKEASLNQTAYYKLMDNIDLYDKEIYQLGSISNSFAGNLNGNDKTISNILLSGEEYVGLFGRVSTATIYDLTVSNITVEGVTYVGSLAGVVNGSATFKGVKVHNVDISGSNSVGGLIGYATGNSYIQSVMVDGDISGVDYVGGIVGNLYGASVGLGSSIYHSMYEGNVTGNNYVAGIAGTKTSSYTSINSAANRGGTITCNNTCNRIVTVNTPENAIANQDILVNGVTVTNNSLSSTNGKDFIAAYVNDINIYETGYIDTYIGGDQTLTDGYYYDYNEDGLIDIVKATATLSLSGAGTALDPYLIYDYDDLIQMPLNRTAYYKLMADIDLAGKKSYMLASQQNVFTGGFDGNGHTLSNVVINGLDHTGLFGRMTGTASIENLTIDGLDVTGATYVGGIMGYQSGPTVKGVRILDANITGLTHVGGISGVLNNASYIYASKVEGDITGGTYVGGIVGYLSGAIGNVPTLQHALYNGDVTGNNYSGGIAGGRTTSYTMIKGVANLGGSISCTTNCNRIVPVTSPENAISNSNVLLNGVTVTNVVLNSVDGYDVNPLYLNDVNIYETAGLDTYINGDQPAADGYYIDYNGLGNIDIVKATGVITMSGTGVFGDPYLIYDYADFKEAALNKNGYYKLMANINFSGQKFYMLGSDYNLFYGNFDGNGYTLSNIVINGLDNTGIFGKTSSNASIYNLTVNNIEVNGKSKVGAIAGAYSNSTMYGVKVYNADINGTTYSGGLIGVAGSNVTIQNIIVEGVVTGTDYVGGVLGQLTGLSANNAYLYDSSFKGDVSGSTYVSGIVGNRSSSYSTIDGAVNLGGNITCTTNCARIIAVNTPLNAISYNGVLINGSTVAGGTTSSANGQDKTSADLLLQATYTSVGFNFTDTTPGTYIWSISGSDLTFTRN